MQDAEKTRGIYSSFIVDKRIGKSTKEWHFEMIESIDYKTMSVYTSLIAQGGLTVMIRMPAQKADQEQVTGEDEP